MNACDAVQELLTAHLLSSLGPSEDALVLDHLESCDVCCKVKDETEACVSLLAAPPVKAPPQVWSRIRTRIEREAMGDPVRDTGEPSPIISLSCSFCRGGMTREVSVYCASCLAPHHPECFREYGRCSVMGCAESRVVRPSELPPLQLHRGGKAPAETGTTARPRRKRRGRWFLGGLSVAVLGVGAAALTQQEQPEVLNPNWEVQPVDMRSSYRVEIEQATLGEVVEAMRKELPDGKTITLSDPCRDLLIRHAEFDGVHWTEALTQIAARFDLRVSEDAMGWRIDRPQGFDPQDHPLAQEELLQLDTTRVFPLGDETGRALHQGWAYDVHVSPDGRALAVEEGRKLSLFQGLKRKGFAILDAPCTDLAWSRYQRRLAYVAGGTGGGQLGVFDLSGDRFTHTVVRSFPGADDSAQLIWCEPDDRILLKTRDDLKLVSTLIGGQAITLTQPSPSGYRRFDLVSTPNPGQFLVLYPDGIEVWQLGNTANRLFEQRTRLPAGYEVRTPVGGGGRCVVMLASQALLFEANSGSCKQLEERSSVDEGEAFRVDLDSSGWRVAFLKRHADAEIQELMVRSLLDPSAGLEQCEPPSGVVQGFRWSPSDAQIAYWTEDAVYAERVDRPVLTADRVASFEESRVLDVQWLRMPKDDRPALVVTTRGMALRKALVRVERIGE